MLRTLIASAVVGLLFATGSMVPATSYAYVDWGRTWAHDQVLKPGCHHYRYHFRINPPSDNWAAETFLIGPKGGQVSSGALLEPSDPSPGIARFRLCRASVIAGKYKIRMKITYKIDYEKHEGFAKPSYFRLTRR